ncbi:MAG: amidohydrolase family protein [Acidimicrobiia bacterium]|nr:amidohydrolase family protein [Acidimicrobiia bacterium]MDH5421581.1 amidohydrolase family protein [Acidimicrobiia bacterium]MDH5504007.1 amidohydrolase family protein [Acidimicrobiia bacterium]
MRTVFTGGEIFDVETKSFRSSDVVVLDGRIAEIGQRLDGDASVDMGGRTILPGLIDSHVHVMISSLDLFGAMQEPYSLRFYRAIANLRANLEAGITTIRDAGGADLGVKRAVDDGLIAGPNMLIAIGMLSQTGGHGDGWLASGMQMRVLAGDHPGAPQTVVDGPEEIRKKVRELVRAGADVIKVATSGGVMSPRSNPRHAHFDPAELQALVAEATSAGLYVMAHAQATDGIKNAVRAGVRSVEHGIYLDDEAIELMIHHGTYLVPTLIAPTGVARAAAAGARIPEASLLKAAEVTEIHRQSFAKAVKAGVKIAMGTDTGVTPHGENLDELSLMVAGGMDPLDVLVATTQSAADLLGLGGEIGSLAPGKRADLTVISGDPLDFDAWTIESVWKSGVRVVG